MKPEEEYYSNGNKATERWYLNGKYHREDGPAYKKWFYNSNIRIELWFKYGKRHRENGPAFIIYNQDGSVKESTYFINGIQLSLKDIRKIKLEKISFF